MADQYAQSTQKHTALVNEYNQEKQKLEEIGRTLRKEYESGASISYLSTKYDYSIHRIRKYLTIAGTVFRKRGPNPNSRKEK